MLHRGPRQLRDLDVDVVGTGAGGCGGDAEEVEEEAAGAGDGGEGVKGCAEGGDCADGDGHCLLGCRFVVGWWWLSLPSGGNGSGLVVSVGFWVSLLSMIFCYDRDRLS